MSTSKSIVLSIAAAGFFLAFMGMAGAATLEGNPANYRDLIPTLKPGDTLKLAAGEYTDQLRLKNLKGEEGKPIVVTGPESGAPAVFVASKAHNTAQLKACAHVTLRRLKLDGKDLDGPCALLLSGGGHHIVLEDLAIVGYGAHQSQVGIGCYDGEYYWDCVIRRCVFRAPGTGMYLGEYQGKGGFVRGLIENCAIINPVGYCAQLKPQTSRPESVPEGQTVIRHNVFVKAENASGGGQKEGARPCLNINPFPDSGRGSGDMYLIYGNVFYQNYMADALFQGAGNIALYNNLFVNELGKTDAVNFQNHVNGKIRKVWVFNNTVVCKGRGIRIGDTDDQDLYVFGNAVFAGKPLGLSANVKAGDNLTATYEAAAQHLNAPLAKPGELDLFPKAGKLMAPKAFDYGAAKEYRDRGLDFNGAERVKPYYGAYAAEGANPGWKLDVSGAGTPPAPAGSAKREAAKAGQ